MREFMRLRGMEGKLGPAMEASFPWLEDEGFHEFGCWWRAPLRRPWPEPSPDFDTSTWERTYARGRKGERREQYKKAIHCSSVYNFWGSVEDGLRPSPGRGGHIGVYCMPMHGNLVQAVASSGYAVYSGLGKDGYYWTTKYELAVGHFMSNQPDIGKMSEGNQWVAKEKTYHVMAVWFHCLHRSEFKAAAGVQWLLYDDWHPEYEVPPSYVIKKRQR